MPVLTRNNIAACQIHKRRTEFYFSPEIKQGLVLFKKGARSTVRKSIRTALEACAGTCFLALLPENSVAVADIGFLQDQASKLQLTIIAGLEHQVTWLRRVVNDEGDDYENSAYSVENQFVVLRPDGREPEFGKKNFPARVFGHSILEQIERNLNPEFPYFPVPTPDGSEMNVWPILCSDFLEITSERLLQELDRKIRTEQIDLITVLSHTHRPDVFHEQIKRLISGGISRSVPTNILFANLAQDGGSICLAHAERKELRTNWISLLGTRMIPRGEESFRVFEDWPTTLQAVRTERTRPA